MSCKGIKQNAFLMNYSKKEINDGLFRKFSLYSRYFYDRSNQIFFITQILRF